MGPESGSPGLNGVGGGKGVATRVRFAVQRLRFVLEGIACSMPMWEYENGEIEERKEDKSGTYELPPPTTDVCFLLNLSFGIVSFVCVFVRASEREKVCESGNKGV